MRPSSPSLKCFVSLLALSLYTSACEDVGLAEYNYETDGALLSIDPLGDVEFARTDPEETGAYEEVLLWAAGDEVVPIIDVFLEDYSSSAFDIRGDLPLPLLLEPGAEFPVEVTFEPYAVGQFTGAIVVQVDVEGEVVELSRRLVGQGCDPEGNGEGCN